MKIKILILSLSLSTFSLYACAAAIVADKKNCSEVNTQDKPSSDEFVDHERNATLMFPPKQNDDLRKNDCPVKQ